MSDSRWKLGRNQAVIKGTLHLRPESFSCLSWLSLQDSVSNVTRGTPSACATTNASLVQMGLSAGALYFWGRNFFAPITLRCGAGWLNIRGVSPCATTKFGGNQELIKATLHLKLNILSSLYSLALKPKNSNIGRNEALTKGTLPLKPKHCFVRISPRITVGWLKYATRNFQRMHYMQCKLGCNRPAMKSTLLKRPQVFRPISPLNTAGWLKYATWQSLRMRY
jgi:hypothetical protein